MEIQHLNIHIYGKVHGVNFRRSLKEKAIKLGVNGFARNEPDGSVYTEAEGDREVLVRFVEYCRQGPVRARVDRVEVAESSVHIYQDFENISSSRPQ